MCNRVGITRIYKMLQLKKEKKNSEKNKIKIGNITNIHTQTTNKRNRDRKKISFLY